MGRNRIVNLKQSNAFSTTDVANPAANNAAVITYSSIAAPTGVGAVNNQPVPAGLPLPATFAHVITGFRASCSATAILAPPPKVTIKDGPTNVVFEQFLDLQPTLASSNVSYALDVKWTLPKRNTAGNALTLTASNPGSGNVISLVVLEHWVEMS